MNKNEVKTVKKRIYFFKKEKLVSDEISEKYTKEIESYIRGFIISMLSVF